MTLSKGLTIAVLGVAALSFTRDARAQAGTQDCSAITAANLPTTCLRNNTVSGTMPTITRLTLAAGTATLNGPVVTDFDAADSSIVVNTAAATITVASNRAVTLTAAGAAWTGGVKTLGDLRLRSGTTGGFLTLAATAATVPGTPTGSATGRRVYPIDYQTRWNLGDAPATYSMVVTYSLTAP
jgi:hypothetical protein